MDVESHSWKSGHGRERRREFIIHQRNRFIWRRTGRRWLSNPLAIRRDVAREGAPLHEGGFFLIVTLTVLIWFLGVALFWYTSVEREVRYLEQETLAIRFETHLWLAETACRSKERIVNRPTGTVRCMPQSANRARIEIELKSGERHSEVIRYEE